MSEPTGGNATRTRRLVALAAAVAALPVAGLVVHALQPSETTVPAATYSEPTYSYSTNYATTAPATYKASASRTPTPTPSISPEVKAWMDKVNADGKHNYGPADAQWSCDHIRNNTTGLKPPWSMVGDIRLIWAGRLLCKGFSADADRAEQGFFDGDYVIGEKVKPGTYVNAPGSKGCYWELVNGSGATIANDFVSFAPDGVTLQVPATAAGLQVKGCGTWVPAA